MPPLAQSFAATIIGGGPAGLAPLLAAHRQGRLGDLLDAGVLIIEQSDRLGCGEIGRYAINSDSNGLTFVDCLTGSEEALTALRTHKLAREVAAAGDGPVPLALAGRFLSLVGATLGRIVAAHPRCAVLTSHRAVAVGQTADGWSITAIGRSGRKITVQSRSVVSATGAHQPAERLARETVGGIVLAERHGHKLVQSGNVLSTRGLRAVADWLAGRPDPRVAIVGGSTSAAAVAHALLHRLSASLLGKGAVTLLHRRPLHIYYPSAAEARAEGYGDFDENDICPVTKRVFRLAGFRLDSRELIMQARGIGGRPPETRLALHRLQHQDPEAESILDGADLVVAAIGYRPRAVPIFDRQGNRIGLHAFQHARAPLVDGQCRVLDARGMPLPGLFGIGLAAGFVPRGALGGEPSFSGQANGLWLWQNDVGLLIVDALLEHSSRARSAPTAWMPFGRACLPATAAAKAWP